MNRNQLFTAITGAAFLRLSSSAFSRAVAVTFDFGGSFDIADSLEFTEEGLTVTATASNLTAGETTSA